MGNRVHIISTLFSKPNDPLYTSNKGFRIYDSESSCYWDGWEDIPSDPLELLSQIMCAGDNSVQDMMGWVKNNQSGVYINESWLDYDEIKDVLNAEYEEDDEGILQPKKKA